jgi:SPX domain protein involved in polyphosphate accumulation
LTKIKFNRHELKYKVNRDQYQSLSKALSDYMQPDAYGDQHGRYLVTSLYYDTTDYKAYWDKIQGHRFRRKLRVRVYGEQTITPDTPCFVEIKQRTDRTIQKKRVVLPYSSAIDLCETGADVNLAPEAGGAVAEEVSYLRSALKLQPACVVSYDRLAFNGTDRGPGLRVTFDTNMKCRAHELSLLPTGYAENRFFTPPQWCIMEIKADGSVPLWLTKLIAEYGCTRRNISKYCTALEKCLGALQNQRIKTYQPEFGVGLN